MITNNSNYKAINQTLNVFNNPQPLNIPFAPQHLHDNIIISTGKPSNITSFNPIVNQKDLPRTIQIVINNNNPISQSSKGERPLPTPNLLRSYSIDPSLLCSPKSIDKIPALSPWPWWCYATISNHHRNNHGTDDSPYTNYYYLI